MKYLTLSIFMYVFSVNSFAKFQLELPGYESFTEGLMDELPTLLKETINRKVLIRFDKKLAKGKKIISPCEKSGQYYGQLKNKNILLNSGFEEIIQKGKKGIEFFCGHKSFYKLLKATIIHELAHLFEISSKSNYSESSEYTLLAHGKKRFLRKNKLKNKKHDRSPDPYEFKNTSEHFAVNFEYFLLDETYSCRRPNLSRYFKKIFDHTTYPCNAFGGINYQVKLGEDQRTLNPEKVIAIDYLFAGKGPAVMSKWGHAMFRVVMCPEGIWEEQLCRAHTSSDIVIGFVAQVNDQIINNIAGLTGKYPSKIFIQPFRESILNYNKGEFRDLTSYPMALTTQQRTLFINQALSLYWEYAGKYYFLSNNCATEALLLLQGAINSASLKKLKVKTPIGLRNKLESIGMIGSRAQVFESYQNKLEKIASRVSNLEISFDYLVKSLASERLKLYRELTNLSRQEVFALLSIENYLAFSFEKRLRKESGMGLYLSEKDDPIRKVSSRYIEIQNLISYGPLFDSGYGIPLVNETKNLDKNYYDKYRVELNSLSKKLEAWVFKNLTEQMDELDQIKEIREFLAQKL